MPLLSMFVKCERQMVTIFWNRILYVDMGVIYLSPALTWNMCASIAALRKLLFLTTWAILGREGGACKRLKSCIYLVWGTGWWNLNFTIHETIFIFPVELKEPGYTPTLYKICDFISFGIFPVIVQVEFLVLGSIREDVMIIRWFISPRKLLPPQFYWSILT